MTDVNRTGNSSVAQQIIEKVEKQPEIIKMPEIRLEMPNPLPQASFEIIQRPHYIDLKKFEDFKKTIIGEKKYNECKGDQKCIDDAVMKVLKPIIDIPNIPNMKPYIDLLQLGKKTFPTDI